MGRLRYAPLVYFSALLKVIKMKKMTSVQQYAHCVIVNFFRIQSVSMQRRYVLNFYTQQRYAYHWHICKCTTESLYEKKGKKY